MQKGLITLYLHPPNPTGIKSVIINPKAMKASLDKALFKSIKVKNCGSELLDRFLVLEQPTHLKKGPNSNEKNRITKGLIVSLTLDPLNM